MFYHIVKPLRNKIYLIVLIFSYIAYFCYLFALKKIDLLTDINRDCYGNCSLALHVLMSLALIAPFFLSTIPGFFIKRIFCFSKSEITRKLLVIVFFLISLLLFEITMQVIVSLALDANLIEFSPYSMVARMRIVGFTSPIIAVLQKIIIDVISIFIVFSFIYILAFSLRFFCVLAARLTNSLRRR